MLSTFYQMVKDVFAAARQADTEVMTAAQIDRTLEEVHRLRERDISIAKAEAIKKKGMVTHDFMDRGLYNTSVRENAEKDVDRQLAKQVEDIESQAKYALDMLTLERKKLAV